MASLHQYQLQLKWTGNTGMGTAGYRSYSRNHTIQYGTKPLLHLSSDPTFLGDPNCYNPEELLLGALVACHMLWYLHLCADAGVVVVRYEDTPIATMEESKEGGGRFTGAVLRPNVTVSNPQHIQLAMELHHAANQKCFIANSVNFPVNHQATVIAG